MEYRAILETIADEYYEVDLSGKLTFFNDSHAELHGRNRSELTGMKFKDYTIKEDIGKVFIAFKDVYETRKSHTILQYVVITKDGKRIDNETSISLIKDKEGRPIGFTDMLLDTSLDNVQKDYLSIVKKSGEVLVALLNDILDFSKIESGNIEFQEIVFESELVIYDVTDIIRTGTGSKSIELLCRIDDKKKYLEAGMNDYITKSIKREIVFQMLEQWVFKKHRPDVPNI